MELIGGLHDKIEIRSDIPTTGAGLVSGPYPAPKARIADRPVKDGGNNFGRVARLAGLMDEYTSALRVQRIAGIPADHWILFFKRHAEATDPMAILDHLKRDLRQSGLNKAAAVDVAEAISRIVARFR